MEHNFKSVENAISLSLPLSLSPVSVEGPLCAKEDTNVYNNNEKSL